MWSAEKRAEALEYMHPKPSSHSGRIEEQVRVLPAIEAELHLFLIGREMLSGDVTPCSCDPALQAVATLRSSVKEGWVSGSDLEAHRAWLPLFVTIFPLTFYKFLIH